MALACNLGLNGGQEEFKRAIEAVHGKPPEPEQEDYSEFIAKALRLTGGR